MNEKFQNLDQLEDLYPIIADYVKMNSIEGIFYQGKVRDCITICNQFITITTDRISAFDVVLPPLIKHKGAVLEGITRHAFAATADIVSNWHAWNLSSTITVGEKLEAFPVEIIVRGYLTGGSWSDYKKGLRVKSGVVIPNGMVENQKFDSPIITPTTKAENGSHDEDISREEIIAIGLVSEEDYVKLEKYALALFARGQQVANENGLILVDTKYEFGKNPKTGKISLIDEAHTPDSSRYWYLKFYQDRFEKGLPQKSLSKEFVREWLKSNGFEGKPGQEIPFMTEEFIAEISARYIEMYEVATGKKFDLDLFPLDSDETQQLILDFIQ